MPGALQRTDALATIDLQQDLISADAQIEASAGGPWFRDFGTFNARRGRPTRYPDIADNGRIIAVTGVPFDSETTTVSLLRPENLGVLYERACEAEPRDCEYTRESTTQPAIRMVIEQPVEGGVYSGVDLIRGWAFYDFDIASVTVTIDGGNSYLASIPYGDERVDVFEFFQREGRALNSGFSTTFNFGELAPGPHRMDVRVTSKTGEQRSLRRNFTVAKFHKPFIDAGDGVDTGQALATTEDSAVQLDGVVVDGRRYNLRLEWQTASQTFELVEIVEQ